MKVSTAFLRKKAWQKTLFLRESSAKDIVVGKELGSFEMRLSLIASSIPFRGGLGAELLPVHQRNYTAAMQNTDG